MKLLTAIKKAIKKAEQSNGEINFFVKRKYGLKESYNNDWIHVDFNSVQNDAELKIEDLIANDWIVEEE